MADDTLKIKVEYEVDDSKLNQSLSKLQSNTSKSLSSGSNSPQASIDKHVAQLSRVQDKIKLLDESYGRAFNQPNQERNLAKITSELSSQYGHLKNLAGTSSGYLQNLEKEVQLRKQSTLLVNQANKNEGVYSAHSERQFAMLQQITRSVPGGGILDKFIGGAGRAAGAEGEGAGLLSKAGLAGGGMAAGAAAAAAGIALLVSKVNELASRSTELAQSASSATSQLGQLRSQIEKTAISRDMAASSPNSISIAGIQSFVGQQVDNFVSHLFNSQQDRDKGVSEKIGAGLGGNAKEQWRRILEQRQDMEVDLSRNRQATDIQFQRTDRDFELEKRKFAIDTQNTLFDMQKTQQREQQDYSLAKKQFDENFQGKMAATQFAFQKQYAQQDYQLNVQRQTQDYQITRARAAQDLQINLQDKAYDFGVSRQRATQDYSIQKSDTKFDFSRSLSRNQQEFDINKSRQGEDFQETKLKMALGGASGQDYLFANMDYRKEQARQAADFERQKKIATEDYSTQLGRGDRDFNLSQSRSLADYNLSNFRDIRGFNLSQQRGAEDFSKTLGRGAQDFGIQNQRMDTGRQLQIETELYDRKYQGIQLELQHNRNLQDENIAMQRFKVSTGLQQEQFGNRASDIAVDKGLAYRDLGINEYRARRNQGYAEQDFAGQQRKDDPLGAYGQSLTDPAFAKALADNAKATGQLDLGKQVQATRTAGNIGGGFMNDPGAALGDIARFLTFGADFQGNGNGNGNGSQNTKSNSQGNFVFDAGSPTYNLGISDQDKKAIDDKWTAEMNKVYRIMESLLKDIMSG